ncbi:MAG: hypothetical protein LBE37_14340 [Sphingobacterium sp.]|jgi:hypothetical protein|nr:hypothetical protein [Sphingobacterium sp.]
MRNEVVKDFLGALASTTNDHLKYFTDYLKKKQHVREMTTSRYPSYPVHTDHPVVLGFDGYDIHYGNAEELLFDILSLYGIAYLDNCYFHPHFPVVVYSVVAQDLLKHYDSTFRLQRKIKDKFDGILTRHFRGHGFLYSVKPYVAVNVVGYMVYIIVARDETGFSFINYCRNLWKQK